jgi:H+/Cl- antiporter ClcA
MKQRYLYRCTGAAAFFGGLTRLTFSLAVVMIEITDETHFLLPIMTAGETCATAFPQGHLA